MPSRIQKEKPKVTHKEAEELAAEDAAVQEAQQREADLQATDDLLDEIDSVLEVNAEEFVKAYVQKGGQ